MTAREYLRQYGQAVKKIRRLQGEYKERMKTVDAIRSPLAGDGIHTGAISKTVETQAVLLASKAEELKLAIVDAAVIRQDVFDTIQSIPEEVGAVLYARYIQLQRWDEVADSVNYSKRQVFRLHEEGLRIVGEIIDASESWH